MFDFAWSEIALVGIVALIAIGPKDLPVAIKTVAELIKKARRMAGEFQTHVDEMVREANLGEVRDQFNDLRRMDIKGKILDAVDSDKSLRNTIADNPIKDAFNDLKSVDINPMPPPVPVHDSPLIAGDGHIGIPGLADQAVAAREEHTIANPDEPAVEADPPPFIPPAVAATGLPSKRPLPPAFVPPAVVAGASSRLAYASPYA